MGVYQKYKDKDGRPIGPWFVKYPYRKDMATGKIKYKIEKASYSKKLAQRIYSSKYEEYKRREHLDWEEEKALSLRELVDWYLELPAVKGRICYRDIKRNCENWRNYFGDILADEIKPSMVEKYREERLQQISYRGKHASRQKVTPASVNREVATLKRIFNLAIREVLVSKNPCWKVERLPEDNERKRILSQNELNRLLDELPQHAKDIILTAYYTGMRAGEIFNLTWDKVDLNDGYIQLAAKDTKTKKPRRIYVNDVVLEILKRLDRIRHLNHNNVFTYKGNPIQSIKACLKRACQKAKIEDFRFHDLRHTFNTMMRKAGVSKSVIMHLTGHKTSTMFDRYNTIDEEDARDALKKLKEYVEMRDREGSVAEECSHSAPKRV
ncbi:MAG: tyrosine-type recombinase/integrase [Thermodesulfobacteriota bacterium]